MNSFDKLEVMDTQNLQAFYTAASLGSFSEAAKKLHLTQPAISKRIANLESQLNTPLFDRIGRQVALTHAGKRLLPQAQSILKQVQGVIELMSDIDGQVSGQLSIATSHHIGMHRLPPILRKFINRYPQVALDLQFLDSDQIYAAIQKGHHDLAIATLSLSSHGQVVSHPLWQDDMYVVVNPDHPLAKMPQVSLQDLSTVTAILPERSTSTYQAIKHIFEQHQVPLEIHKTSNNLDAIKMMIDVGLGWGVLPQTLVDKKLTVIQLEQIKFTRTLGYLHHKQRSLSKAAQMFIGLLRE